MIARTTEFSPEAYAALIGAFRGLDYSFAGFADAEPQARQVIVRHDVDFSLDAAQAMAEAERRLGISATYFILLRSEFYNPLSEAGLATLGRIASSHAVGLHFDAGLYPADAGALDAAAARECEILAQILGRPVELVSFHRPAAGLIGEAARIGGRINAYGPRYIREMGYCSDSRGGWHHGHPLDHAAIRDRSALQLLVHPFWWQAPSRPPVERLRAFLAERSAYLDGELARHCAVHVAKS